MASHISLFALLVKDYDEALNFYCNVLGFIKTHDSITDGKRWLTISPSLSSAQDLSNRSSGLLLSKVKNKEDEKMVGNQALGKVLLFLYTDQFDEDHQRLLKNGVDILEGPFDRPYGRVLVFADLYGNRIDLINPRA